MKFNNILKTEYYKKSKITTRFTSILNGQGVISAILEFQPDEGYNPNNIHILTRVGDYNVPDINITTDLIRVEIVDSVNVNEVSDKDIDCIIDATKTIYDNRGYTVRRFQNISID